MKRIRAITTASALVALVLGAISETSVAAFSSTTPHLSLEAPAAGGAPTLGEWVAARAARARIAPGDSAAATWIESTGVSRAAWKSALTDPTVRVGANGRAFVVEPVISAAERAMISAQSATPVTDIPLSDAFLLNSKPGSSKTIYLDFNGHSISGTQWNDVDIPDGTFFQAFDQDNNTATFSSSERQAIIDAWSLVAEDYAAFDVNVTTQDPGSAAIYQSYYSDNVYGSRAVITSGPNAIADSCGCGGIAYVGVFGLPKMSPDYLDYTPAWAFAGAGDSGKIIADIVSHEVGHNLGLSHDGLVEEIGDTPLNDNAYYLGAGAWAPIMGAGYYTAITHWSDGDYSGISQADNITEMVGNNTEDDYAVFAENGLSAELDEAPETYDAVDLGSDALETATTTVGFIGNPEDIDYYAFVATDTSHTVSVTSPTSTPNLDVELIVRDSAGTIIGSAVNPSIVWSSGTPRVVSSGMGAEKVVSTTIGETYFVGLTGVGSNTANATYSDYGSIGEYRLGISGTPFSLAPTPTISGTAKVGVPLTANVGTWSPTAEFTYQWRRGGSIVGTSNTYTPVAADRGSTLTVSVRGTASGISSQTKTSAATTAVAYGTISPAPTPKISGTRRVGKTLTVLTGTWKSGVTKTYRWQRCSLSTGSCSNISGATSKTYKLKSTDRGKKIRVKVGGKLSGYSTMVKTSSKTSTITW